MAEQQKTQHNIRKTKLGALLFWTCSCGTSSPRGYETERERYKSIHTHLRNSRR